jgi:hypothetical protein
MPAYTQIYFTPSIFLEKCTIDLKLGSAALSLQTPDTYAAITKIQF